MSRSEDPLAISWMVPSVPPSAPLLIDARRETIPACGPSDDCLFSIPSAALAYGSSEPGGAHSLQIKQTWPRPDDVYHGKLPGGVERTMAGRTVLAIESGEGTSRRIRLTWTDANDLVVDISSSGISWEELSTTVETLEPADPSAWPTPVVVPHCVDATTQYAPALIPDGWERFVLQAQPTGTCDVAPYLFISLVLPGTSAGPGTLVTIVVNPAVTVVADEVAGDVTEGIAADGSRATSTIVQIGGVTIDAHGNADAETLRSIVASIVPFSDAEWAQLVSEVDAG